LNFYFPEQVIIACAGNYKPAEPCVEPVFWAEAFLLKSISGYLCVHISRILFD